MNIRGGHRTCASKLVNNVAEILSSDSIESARNQRKTLKLSLSEKLHDLKKLDSEVVELVETEHEIDHEICESSDYASKIQSCITDIDSALSTVEPNSLSGSSSSSHKQNSSNPVKLPKLEWKKFS